MPQANNRFPRNLIGFRDKFGGRVVLATVAVQHPIGDLGLWYYYAATAAALVHPILNDSELTLGSRWRLTLGSPWEYDPAIAQQC